VARCRWELRLRTYEAMCLQLRNEIVTNAEYYAARTSLAVVCSRSTNRRTPRVKVPRALGIGATTAASPTKKGGERGTQRCSCERSPTISSTTTLSMDAGRLSSGVRVCCWHSTLMEAPADPTITEVEAGVHCPIEPGLLNKEPPLQCATAIRDTVISRHSDHVVVDIGHRVVGTECGPR
jgi:hypothetical protein